MTLYYDDIVAWSREQADLLRSMPETHSLDIANLVDEIEGLGRTAIAELSSAIRQLLSGLICRSIDPGSISVEDILAVQSEAVIRSDAGVWRHVDLDKIWRLAKRPLDIGRSERCPITIEQLISEDFDVGESVTALRS